MISIKDLNYKSILNGVEATLNQEFNYIRGENGAGKTTLLDCISGINNQYEGEINGNNNLVYLNQSLFFSHKLKSKDFVKFVFSLENIKNYKEIYFNFAEENRIMDELEKNWDKEVGILSGGERKKLYFSTICCLNRDWYVFDEPFAGVDENGKTFMTNIFNQLIGKNKGIILTSHEVDPLQEIKDVQEYHLISSQLKKISST